MSTKIVVDCRTGQERLVALEGAELAEFEATRPAPLDLLAGSGRDARLVAALQAPKAALAQAKSLDEVKAVVAQALDGLANVLGGGS